MPGYSRLRLPSNYHALTVLNARDFAWEWLRRNPEFREIAYSASAAARRASVLADAALRRSTRSLVDIPQHPSARRWSPWGLTFRV
jgi:hypothetical protein